MLTVIFSLTPLEGNLATEAAIASVLVAQGEQVLAVVCEGSRDRCIVDNFLPADLDRTVACRECSGDSRRHHRLSPTVQVEFDTLVDHAQRDAALVDIDALSDEALYAYSYDGMPFGEWLIDGLRLAYFGENWQQLNNLAEICRKTLQSMVVTALAAEEVIRRYQPQTFLILNGIIPCEHVAWVIGQRSGIHSVLYEGGQRPGTIHLNETSPACYYDVSEAWAKWRNVPLTQAESCEMDHFMIRRMYQAEGGYVYSPSATGSGAATRQRLDLPPDLPLLVAYTNCSADTSVFAANTVFPQQIEWIGACISYAAAHPEIGLVIRIHPVEATTASYREGKVVSVRDKIADGITERWPQLPANVRVVGPTDSISSYDLMLMARVVLAYVSTVGIEAAALGRPVINAGRYHYTDKGFTYAPATPEAFTELLDDLIADPRLPPQAVELARRYFHLWMYRSMLPMPNLDVDPQSQATKLRIRPSTDQARGRHVPYDHLVSYMRHERPFIDAPAPWRLRDDAEPRPLRFPAVRSLLCAPEWNRLADFARTLLQLVGDQPRPVLVSVLSGTLSPDEAGQRLVDALIQLAPPERWPDLEAIPGNLGPQELGRLLTGAEALLCSRRLPYDDPLLAMAAHGGLPVVTLDDSAAVRSLANRLQAAIPPAAQPA